MQKTLELQLQQQTEGKQQAEASLANLHQEKGEEDEALAAEKQSRQEAEDALVEVKKRLHQASRVQANPFCGDFVSYFASSEMNFIVFLLPISAGFSKKLVALIC